MEHICDLPWREMNELDIGYIHLKREGKTELVEMSDDEAKEI